MKYSRQSSLSTLMILILALFSTLSQAAQVKPSRPNLLFIFLDDFGWRDTGYMGADFFETPHIDKLAGEGM